jgi:glycosyltransferase involved in cell wall biosynthesis
MDISVVVPCYRSRGTLRTLVQELHTHLPAVTGHYEVILVVDGSPDDTYAIARDLERENPRHVRAVMLRRNYGQHNALLAGIARAKYDVIVTMDDDLQHRPDQIPALVAPLADPMVDLVYGVDSTEEHGFWRSLASRTVKRGLAAADVPNAQDVSAFRAFRTDLRDGFIHVADAFVSVDVLLSWTTTGVRRAAIQMRTRQEGESAYTLAGLVRHALNMITGYGTFPLRIVTWLGVACSALGMVLLAVFLWKYVTGATTVAGFTSTAAMIAIFSGAQMLSLGIIGEYLGRLHFRSMQRPMYLVRVDGAGQDGPRAGVPGASATKTAPTELPDDVAHALRARHGSTLG